MFQMVGFRLFHESFQNFTVRPSKTMVGFLFYLVPLQGTFVNFQVCLTVDDLPTSNMLVWTFSYVKQLQFQCTFQPGNLKWKKLIPTQQVVQVPTVQCGNELSEWMKIWFHQPSPAYTMRMLTLPLPRFPEIHCTPWTLTLNMPPDWKGITSSKPPF